MSYELFSISIPDGRSELEKLNEFLCVHRVVMEQKQIVARDGVPFFVFLVEYSPSKNTSTSFVAPQQSKCAPVDYKSLLTAEQFERFLRLKDERAKIANELGVNLFVVFSNENLAEMARTYPKTLAELKAVPGIGEGRVEKYGLRMLNASGKCTEKYYQSHATALFAFVRCADTYNFRMAVLGKQPSTFSNNKKQ